MADFFDKIKKGLNKATTTVSVKSTSMIEINKVKSELSALIKEKKVIFTEIGEKICSMKSSGSIDLSQVESMIEKTVDIESKITEYEEQIDSITKDKDDKLNALDDEVITEAPVSEEVVNAEEIVVDQIPVEEIKTEEAETTSEEQSNETGEYKA
ncbi:MAG: hypothetical protein PF505_11325 [Vallitaleaceae bacterium]|jgi:seryl-tRNA synthetase|nr:hypothetical protein [Vallitaleaceae bacterium]